LLNLANQDEKKSKQARHKYDADFKHQFLANDFKRAANKGSG
jgi:hypothetical protein